MTYEEMSKFRTFIKSYLILIEISEKGLTHPSKKSREESQKTLDFMLPKLKGITLHYLKKLCNNKYIGTNNAYISTLRVEVLQEVRKHVEIVLPKNLKIKLQTTFK